MDPLDLQQPSQTQYGQFVSMTPPETAADWQEFLDWGYKNTCTVLLRRKLVPLGKPTWIEHVPDDTYPGGTYGWKQSFVEASHE